jgi:transposase-like protein
MDWEELLEERFKKTGKHISIVKRRSISSYPPEGSICLHCHAPARYLYLNGKKSSQLLCKICGASSPTHQKRIASKTFLWCPYCKQALYVFKSNSTFTAYKCNNRKCSHYLAKLKKLTAEEKNMYDDTFSSQFKLHYQFRIYNFNPSKIQVKRPDDNHGVDLSKIHNNNRTFALILTSTINFGLSARTTKDVMKHFFNIDVSHQTVVNYINAAAYHLYRFIDKNCPKPVGIMSADETYISVDGKWFYTWFGIDAPSRAICGFNVTDNREVQSALALLYNALGAPEENKDSKFEIVTDGNPSYDSAVMAYNHEVPNKVISKFKVIGLQNLDSESEEYRSFKQLVERLNRTYKFHTRPRSGFKSLEGAVALTTLFVAFYNFMRPHSALKGNVPVKLDCIKDTKFYPDMWIQLIKSA